MFKNTKFLLIYYFSLLALLLLWPSTTVSPAMPLRLAYMFAVLFPAAIGNRKGLLPVVITCFWGVASNGDRYSYMPTTEYLYLIVVIAFVLLSWNVYKTRYLQLNKHTFDWPLLLYVLLINLLTSVTVETISVTFLVVLLFPFLLDNTDKTIVEKFSLAYLVISIAISLYTFKSISQIRMMAIMGNDSSLRTNWVDPNYMAMQIGMGAVVGVVNCIKFNRLDSLEKVMSLSAIITSVPAILMTGSRGAFLALAVAMIIAIFFSKVQFRYKFLACTFMAILIGVFYSGGYFDLLLNRIADDDGTGSGRTTIWARKLECFANGNVLNYFFGLGNRKGYILGYNVQTNFHNEYLAFFVCYGLVGLVLFLRYLFTPYISAKKGSIKRREIIIFTSYILFCLLTLEPFNMGIVTFFAFIFYLSLLSKYSYEE